MTFGSLDHGVFSSLMNLEVISPKKQHVNPYQTEQFCAPKTLFLEQVGSSVVENQAWKTFPFHQYGYFEVTMESLQFVINCVNLNESQSPRVAASGFASSSGLGFLVLMVISKLEGGFVLAPV